MRSYSDAGQDIFALETNNHKTGGTFLDIGSSDAVEKSNSYLLETEYKWQGMLIDIDPQYINKSRQLRTSPLIVGDATLLNYKELLSNYDMPQMIDYLSLDIDPPEGTLAALKRLLDSGHIFGAITFEHDAYTTEQEIAGYPVRTESRRILKQAGYILSRHDVCFVDPRDRKEKSFEDWYIHPTLVKCDQDDIIEYIRLNTSKEWVRKFVKNYKDGLGSEADVYKYLRKIAGGMKGKLCIDVGANIGSVTTFLSHHADRVISFEPSSLVRSALEDTISLFDLGNVTVEEVALYSEDGTGRIENQCIVNNYGDNRFYLNKDGQQNAEEEITCTRLDNYLIERGETDVFLVKIDAQGSDLEILDGIKEVEPEHIILELWPQELYRRGYNENRIMDSLARKSNYDLFLLRHKEEHEEKTRQDIVDFFTGAKDKDIGAELILERKG